MVTGLERNRSRSHTIHEICQVPEKIFLILGRRITDICECPESSHIIEILISEGPDVQAVNPAALHPVNNLLHISAEPESLCVIIGGAAGDVKHRQTRFPLFSYLHKSIDHMIERPVAADTCHQLHSLLIFPDDVLGSDVHPRNDRISHDLIPQFYKLRNQLKHLASSIPRPRILIRQKQCLLERLLPLAFVIFYSYIFIQTGFLCF